MKTITFECETITPMFLSGADGKTPELRPPSIKGALRFWWRAINANLVEYKNGKWDYSKLKKKEVEIFGGSYKDENGKEVSKRSNVIIKIENNIKDAEVGKNLWDIVEHNYGTKNNGEKYEIPIEKTKGIAYLLYSTFMLQKKEYLKPETSFNFEISFENKKNVIEVLKTVKAFEVFGALGTRSRRGGGSFWIKNVTLSNELKEYKNDLLKYFPEKKISKKDELEKLIKEIFIINESNNNKFSILKGSKIYLFDFKQNWKEALEAIGKMFYEFRSQNKAKITETPNFGFPIVHKNRKITMRAGKWIKENNTDKLLKIERRASPLIFKLIKVDENKIIPIILWLNGELIENGYSIMDKNGNNQSQLSDSIIIDFIVNTLKKKKADIIL